MVVITDITVAASEFALGGLFEEFPDIEIEVERVIPMQNSVMPLFWVSVSNPSDVRNALEADPLVEHVEILSVKDGRALFELDWAPQVDGLIRPLIEHGGDTLRAAGTAKEWKFRIQFRNRELLNAFRESCANSGLEFTLRRLYNPSPGEDEPLLSGEQLDALLTAYDGGLWDVPRQTSVTDVGERIGISSQAASERLRRGVKALVHEYVVPDGDVDV